MHLGQITKTNVHSSRTNIYISGQTYQDLKVFICFSNVQMYCETKSSILMPRQEEQYYNHYNTTNMKCRLVELVDSIILE